MSTITLVWTALPFFVGFSIYLLPRLDRILALIVALVSLGYGLQRVFDPVSLSLELLDHFGVTLVVDPLSGYFILTNALVTAAVILYCWQSGRTAFFTPRRSFCTAVSTLCSSVQILSVCTWP